MAKTSSNLIKLYIRFQLKAFLGLLFFVFFPYLALLIFYTEIPHMQYYFIGILFAIKLLAFDDTKYRKSLIRFLPQYYKSNSNDLIYKSAQSIVTMRNVNLAVIALFIFIAGLTGAK